ncbi:MAG: DUF3127 domain-containing protein [Bacteroidia bacterium]|nr:DUF3127 domain-containing protein [Bacteroidia bacterium]
MNAKGTLHKKFDTQVISDKFKKREFVLRYEDNPMYPQFVSFQLINDKVDLLDRYDQGAEIDVEFNLRGREWTSPQGEIKYFNTLEAWRISSTQSAPAPEPRTQQMPASSGGGSGSVDVTSLPDDDLPF